ncbi:unnamed protein product, partial [Prorocentrum cordatum]
MAGHVSMIGDDDSRRYATPRRDDDDIAQPRLAKHLLATTEPDGSSHQIAGGEGVVGIDGVSEHGERPLLSASAIATRGRLTCIGAFGGYVLKDSEFAGKVHQMIGQRAAEESEGVAPLCLQGGVYKMNALMGVPMPAASSGPAAALKTETGARVAKTRLPAMPRLGIGAKVAAQPEDSDKRASYKLNRVKVQTQSWPSTSHELMTSGRGDREPANGSRKTADAVAAPTVEFPPREPPAKECQINKSIEVAARKVKRQIRANRHALEAKLGKTVDDAHPILKWLPQHAAACLGQCRRGTDGPPVEQRRPGRDWKKLVAEFGERAMRWPLAPGGRRSTVEDRAKSGEFLGCHMRTGALFVMAADGAEKARGFEKSPRGQAWGGKDWGALRGQDLKFPREECRDMIAELMMSDPEAAEAIRALARSAKRSHPTLDEPQGFEGMRQEGIAGEFGTCIGIGYETEPDTIQTNGHEKTTGYDKGGTFARIYQLAVFETRSCANIDNSDQRPERAEEISSLLTQMCVVCIAEMTLRYGLTSGLAVDIETSWVPRLSEQRSERKKQLGKEDPLLTITSPLRTPFTNLRKFSDQKRDAKSEGQATGPDGKPGFVRKETGWLTNRKLLAKILEGHCECPRGGQRCLASTRTTYFIDDLTGNVLHSVGAQAARQEELEWCRGRQIWQKVPRWEMPTKGKKAVTLKWIDTNWGRANNACRDGDAAGIIHKLCEVSMAHFYGDVNREVHMELPEGEARGDLEPMAGKPLHSMHGAADASYVWQDDHIGLTNSRGFQKGVSNPALLYHTERHVQVEVTGILSSKPLKEQSVVHLHRALVWNPFELSARLEADARRAKEVGGGFLNNDRALPKLDDEKTKTYRSATARITRPSMDIPSFSDSAKLQALDQDRMERLAKLICFAMKTGEDPPTCPQPCRLISLRASDTVLCACHALLLIAGRLPTRRTMWPPALGVAVLALLLPARAHGQTGPAAGAGRRCADDVTLIQGDVSVLHRPAADVQQLLRPSPGRWSPWDALSPSASPDRPVVKSFSASGDDPSKGVPQSMQVTANSDADLGTLLSAILSNSLVLVGAAVAFCVLRRRFPLV